MTTTIIAHIMSAVRRYGQCARFAIVADFTDADAYRAYDQDEEHNRARAGLLPMTEQIARVQFEMP